MKKSILILLLGASITTLVGMQQKKDFFELTKTLQGHTLAIRSIVEVKPGIIASGSFDGTIKVWDIHAQQPLIKTLENPGGVRAMIMLQDGRIAAGLENGAINIWNVDSGETELTLHGGNGFITSILQLSDGTLISGSWDQTIKTWNVSTGQKIDQFVQQVQQLGHNVIATPLTFLELPDGRIICGFMHGYVAILNLVSGQFEFFKQIQDENTYTIIPLTKGNLAVTDGHNISIWDEHFRRLQNRLSGNETNIVSLIQLRDGRIASGSSDGIIKIWDIQSGTVEQTLIGSLRPGAIRIIQLQDGSIVSGSADHTIRIWSPISDSSGKTGKTSKEMCRGESSSSTKRRSKIK